MNTQEVFNLIENIIIALIGVAGVAFVVFFVYAQIKGFKEYVITTKNKNDLVDQICNLATKDSFIKIESTIDWRKRHGGVSIYRTNNERDYFSFISHGFDALPWKGMHDLFKALKKRLKGSIEIEYKDIGGGYSSSVASVSSGFTPGGGTGYYVDCSDGGSCRVPVRITLYSPEETRKRKLKKQQEEMEKNKYKKTF